MKSQTYFLENSSALDSRASAVSGYLYPEKTRSGGAPVELRRILVATALDGASAWALDHALAMARCADAEVALLYVLEDPADPRAARIESDLWRAFASMRVRHPKARLFLRAGPVGEHVGAVARVLEADLIVTSREYHGRFLGWLPGAEEGGSKSQGGLPCPVAVVNEPVGTGVSTDATGATIDRTFAGRTADRRRAATGRRRRNLRLAVKTARRSWSAHR